MNLPTMTQHRTTSVLLAGALLAGVVGCSASTAPDGPAAGTASSATGTPATATPTPTPTPEPVAAEVGAVITQAQAEQLPEGMAAAPLTDGSFVVVDPAQPLPEVVVADIMSSLPPEVPATTDFGTMPHNLAQNQAADVARDTGRHVILVVQGGSYDADGNLVSTQWNIVATGEADNIARGDISAYRARAGTREQAIGFAHEVLAQVEDPDSYQIIIQE